MKCFSPKQLLKYSTAAAGFLAISSSAQADIVYTDVSPDVLLFKDVFDIDFDSDGTSEIRVIQTQYKSMDGSGAYSNWTYTYYTARVVGMSGAEVIQSGTTPFEWGAFGGLAGALPNGSSIGPLDTFSSKGVMGYSFYYRWWANTSYLVSHTHAGLGGDWGGSGDRHLGVKFQIAGADHFGWIRCDVSSNSKFITVKSFAYEDTPNTPIAAGDVGFPCDVSAAPTGLSTIPGASSITFNWNPIIGSVACQLTAGPAGGSFPFTRNLIGPDIGTSGTILFGSLPPGTYEAKVRCACEITPTPVVSPFSSSVLFNVPAPKLSEGDLANNIVPNPATNNIVLEYNAAQNEQVTFRITNLAGQEIFTETATMFAGKQRVSFDVSDFNSGLYLLQVVNGENRLIEKFEVIK